MNFLAILAISLNPLLRQYMWLILLVGCILIALGIIIGYILGNTSLKRFFYKELEEAEHQGAVQKSVTDNVGMGIIVYDDNEAIYVNNTLSSLKGFIKNGVPRNLQVFLDTYDNGNYLKSNYILSQENGTDNIRVNYVDDNRVFEIKILKKEVSYCDKENFEDKNITEILHIILIEDITQVKDDERRQKELAANVSHELKTPLTVIRASEEFVKNINNGNVPSYEEIKKWSNRILSNAIRMQDIVADFLTLSNNDEMKTMGIFDFYSVVEQSMSNLRDYPLAKGVTIVPPKRDAYPFGFGNSKLIVRIVTNLLTNAVKYIDYDGKEVNHEVKLNIVATSERIGIQVTDNGRGIPEKDIPHLFERFYRVDNSGSREVGGSGLGLAIAKEMAEIHDGTINVVSREREGSTFTIFLQRASTAFTRVYEDVKTGVLPDSEYYNGVLRFLLMQIDEYAQSKKLENIEAEFQKPEFKNGVDKISDSDKKRIISMLDSEKFADLLDELTYVEPYYEDEDDYEDEEDDEFEDNELIENNSDRSELITKSEYPEDEDDKEFDENAKFYANEVLEAFEMSKIALEEEERLEREQREREELERQKKKEAQELLMQPVVQQSVKQNPNADKSQNSLTKTTTKEVKNEKFTSLEQKEVLHIHPINDKKLYNNEGVKFLEKKTKQKNQSKTSQTSKKEKVEPIRSAVRQVLDEAEVIDSKVKSSDTEGKE